jgi:hypothetical protein
MAKPTKRKQHFLCTQFHIRVLTKALQLSTKYVIANEARKMCQASSYGALELHVLEAKLVSKE